MKKNTSPTEAEKWALKVADFNIRAGIAFALLVIAFLLAFIAFRLVN